MQARIASTPQRAPGKALLGILDMRHCFVRHFVAQCSAALLRTLLFHVQRAAERRKRRQHRRHFELLETVCRERLGIAFFVGHLDARRRLRHEPVLPQHTQRRRAQRVRVLSQARRESSVCLFGPCFRVGRRQRLLLECRRTSAFPLDPAVFALEHAEDRTQKLAAVLASLFELRLHLAPRAARPLFVGLGQFVRRNEELVGPPPILFAARCSTS